MTSPVLMLTEDDVTCVDVDRIKSPVLMLKEDDVTCVDVDRG